MDVKDVATKVIREFKLTTLALKNKTTVFLLTFVTLAFGLYSYKSLPKELFPDIALPYVMVQTIYPGNPPVDIENLITRPIEKELESIKGIKVINSTSVQGASSIFIEFNSGVNIKDALQDVKDAVDKAKSDLPNDILTDPIVQDIDFSEFPIININLSGDYSIDELKSYGEIIEDEIEAIAEISKVNIQGINEKEIKINVDPHKLNSYLLSFGDIEGAIASENISVSGGEVKLGDTRRSLRTIGEFTSIDDIRNIIVKHQDDEIVYLKDVAEVIDGYEEATSYARLNVQPVISLQVVKKGGENLLAATGRIEEVLEKIKNQHLLPEDLKISITNDQSKMVKMQLHNLENSMVMSIIFVVGVLFFFLGTRNSLFVGLAIPLSMFMSFVVLSLIDFRINMIVLFALILALGMLVDNAIVVVENIYRFLSQGYSRFEAAKRAVGEIAIPIIASTATTLAAFIPLAFWNNMIGEFMKYLPITLIIVLTSSLFVALVIVPVFAASFARIDEKEKKPNIRRSFIIMAILTGVATLFYFAKANTLANLLMFFVILGLMNIAFLHRLGKWFQNVFLSKLENAYLRVLRFSLRKRNPGILMILTLVLLIGTSIFYFKVREPKVEFFPSNDPKYINIIAELPTGTDIHATDQFMYLLEHDIDSLMGDNRIIVESILTNVGEGAKGERENAAAGPNRGMVTITFFDYELRMGISTGEIQRQLSEHLLGRYPGVNFKFQQNKMGPPTSGAPINIEIAGDDYDKLIALTDSIQNIIENSDIKGIEGLKMDLDIGKPEMIVSIDRDKARRYGLSTGQIASTLRTALYGKEISDFKVGEDEYPIQLRLMDKYRYNIPALMEQRITFRNTQGKMVQVPISAVADFTYSTTYDAVKRKDLNRLITLSSNAISGYNANDIIVQIKDLLTGFTMPEGYTYKFTGEQQDMQESMEFLGTALIIALALIVLILVAQFNSIIKPFIIMGSVVFSTIGVFGGLGTFNMNFIVVMTGVGIVALAGVVVNNAIVLIDYVDLLKQRRRKEMGLEENAFLPVEDATECVVQAGKTRLRPVLLTAITTILGLLPMAIGINIDFASLMSDFDPKISVGGDMTMIWGPISWTIIFGLTFATFLTLVIVPVMYRLATRTKFTILKFMGKAN
ncbi:MAG: efflux RND transporter permease subunit [Bacteroidota bacterium]